MNDWALQFEKVCFGYGPSFPFTLEGVSVNIRKATITAILGPNGAGKSTLLLLALGWLRPSSGQVIFGGRPLQDHSRREMGLRMGLVPQREHLTFEYSVLEYVLLGRVPHLPPLGQPGEGDITVALDALARVGLSRFASRSVFRLSGGELQMVLVARSLTQQPSLLLLDEPTAHLDLRNKTRLVDLLRDLETQGVTILMTTHEPELASALASEVILMEQGSVLFSGPAGDALTTANLSRLYGVPLEVLEMEGRRWFRW